MTERWDRWGRKDARLAIELSAHGLSTTRIASLFGRKKNSVRNLFRRTHTRYKDAPFEDDRNVKFGYREQRRRAQLWVDKMGRVGSEKTNSVSDAVVSLRFREPLRCGAPFSGF